MAKPRFHRLGYWSWGIDPTKLVDPGWAGAERSALIEYLRSGAKWSSSFGYSFCRFSCGTPDDSMGSADLTDAEWIWPEGLWHYVANHGVALPDEFLAHARANHFTIPPFDLESLFPDADESEWVEAATIHGQSLESMVSDDRWEEWALNKAAHAALAPKPSNEEL